MKYVAFWEHDPRARENTAPLSVKKLAFFTTVFLLLIISMVPIPTMAEDDATWIPFIPEAAPGSRSEVLPKSGDTMGLCVDTNFMGMYSLTTYINETRYNILHMPNAGHVSEVGKPAVPMITRFLELPDDVQVSVEIIYEDMQVLEDYNVIPAQEPLLGLQDATEPPFVIDETLYATDAFYPLDIASVEGVDGLDPIVMRGHRIMALTLNPVQFNPVKQELRVYSKIEVRLNYDEPAQVGPLDPRLLSPAFEELLEAFVLNYQPRPLPSKEVRFYGLVSDWTVSTDGLTIIFNLVEDAMWHDDVPLTAEDVKFTIDFYKGQDVPYDTAFMNSIDSVETDGDYTAIVHMAKPYAWVVEHFADVPIMPKHLFATGQISGIAYEGEGGGGAEYLIITHDDFYKPARNLAAWKEKKGLKTQIVNITQIGVDPTADDIADYIQDAYENWQPAPSYILLIGDSDHIPPHYITPHPSAMHGYFEIPTDLHYVTVEGNDYFQDIYIGRLSVNNLAQATTIVNKILDYERNPPDDADFYNQVSACAQFQDEDSWTTARDGFEDRRFVLTSEEIRDYLTQTEGYVVDRIYWARDPDPTLVDGQDPTNYNNGSYDNGDPLPNDLLWPGFAWDGDTQDVTDSINDGRFLIYHRDHGSSRNFWYHPGGYWGSNVDGWGEPDYDTGDIGGLTNDPLLPVVFSIECECGWFDGEVDQLNDPALTRNSESFCEEFVRRQGGGAIAAIGSTRISYSGYNDDMVRGFIDAIWPGFDPSFESGGLFSLGQVLTYGKAYMATFRPPPDDVTEATFEMFHLFGDPELAIWTEQPGELDVSYPPSVGSMGLQTFVVNVMDHNTGAPVHYAKVCLQKDTQVHSVAYTNPNGEAYFAVTPMIGGEMNITATMHNFVPYEGTIIVTDEGAILTVDPDSGPSESTPTLHGSHFDVGEIVDIYFGGTTSDYHFTATAGTFDAPVTVPTGPVEPINVRAVGRSSGKTAVALFRRLPVQITDLYTYCQWDSSTWHLDISGSGITRWDNPVIQLYEVNTGLPVFSNNLKVGTTYTIKADIHNAGDVSATNTKVTFQWADWGLSQRVWNNIGTDTVTVPAGGMAIAETDWTPSITGHTCIMVTIYHIGDENLDNNKGQENTDVLPVSSPGEITFTIGNPTQTKALVYLDAKQIGGTDLWAATIERDYPQVQEPGEVLTGTLVVEAPDGAEIGEFSIFTVSGYIDGELVGGVEIYVKVMIPTTISCSVPLSEVAQGFPVTVSGSINPAVADATVILAYESPDGTAIERTTITDSEGSYSDSYQIDAIGSWSVTASWRGDATHIESFSVTKLFNAKARKLCQILLVLVPLLIALIVYYIRNRSSKVKRLGIIIIIIIILLYYWYCFGRLP